MRSERKIRKMEKHILIFPSRQCSSIPVGFGQGIKKKKKYDNTGTPPYSPDLAPADFYLFPRLKLALKGLYLCDTAEEIMNATEELKRLSQNDFQECFQYHYSG
jgi:transposase